ncbi:hypothetical protein ACFFRR_000456 [Megaselia abdita]
MFLSLILQFLLVFCYASAYDIGLCKEYYNRGSERGDTTPISIPFDYLKNNAPRSNEIFRGNFIINPSNFGKNWISFKPIGSYAKGEEYQVVFDTDEVEIGLVDNVKYKERVRIGDSWVAVKIVIKFDGSIEVYIDEEKLSKPLIHQLPEIYKNKPLFIEFKGPDHKKTEIIVFYDCAYFDRRRTNDTTGFDDSTSSSRQPSRGPQKSLRDPNYENRQPFDRRKPQGSQFSDPNKFLILPGGETIPASSNSQRGPDPITDTNGYDISKCEEYNHQGEGQPGVNPISIPLNAFRNNKANGNDIFRGSFIVNPEKYGTVWISFKPIGEYAKGEEYQVGKFFKGHDHDLQSKNYFQSQVFIEARDGQ